MNPCQFRTGTVLLCEWVIKVTSHCALELLSNIHSHFVVQFGEGKWTLWLLICEPVGTGILPALWKFSRITLSRFFIPKQNRYCYFKRCWWSFQAHSECCCFQLVCLEDAFIDGLFSCVLRNSPSVLLLPCELEGFTCVLLLCLLFGSAFFVANNSFLYRAFFWCLVNSWKSGTSPVIFPPCEQRIETIFFYVQRHKTKYCQASTVTFVVNFTCEKTCSGPGNNPNWFLFSFFLKLNSTIIISLDGDPGPIKIFGQLRFGSWWVSHTAVVASRHSCRR